MSVEHIRRHLSQHYSEFLEVVHTFRDCALVAPYIAALPFLRKVHLSMQDSLLYEGTYFISEIVCLFTMWEIGIVFTKLSIPRLYFQLVHGMLIF